MTRSGLVVIASTRASSGIYEDRCGPVIADWLIARGITTPGPVVVADGEPVDAALRAALADGHDLIISVADSGPGISFDDPAEIFALELIEGHRIHLVLRSTRC